MLKRNRLTLIRDSMKLFSDYIDNTEPKKYCSDIVINVAKMLFDRLELLEEMEIKEV